MQARKSQHLQLDGTIGESPVHHFIDCQFGGGVVDQVSNSWMRNTRLQLLDDLIFLFLGKIRVDENLNHANQFFTGPLHHYPPPYRARIIRLPEAFESLKLHDPKNHG
jgi:hypothetical protein